MNSKEPVYILIPIHNRKDLTLKCLTNLQQNGDIDRYHTVVIDDGSTDGSLEAIQDSFPSVEIILGDGNLWWTGAIELGMQYAYYRGAKYFIWLNDDCYPASNAIRSMVEFCREHPKAIVGAQSLELDHPEQVAFGGKVKTWKGFRFLNVAPGHTQECDLLSGNLVCLPRSLVDSIGYPDPAITPHYGGDSLFLIRAKKAGFQIFVDARHSIFNSSSQSELYPTNWLTTEGEPLKILKLVFTPQSGLSWRVWWQLNWEAYSVWGVLMFIKKFGSILLITLLRYLPLNVRRNLFLHFSKT